MSLINQMLKDLERRSKQETSNITMSGLHIAAFGKLKEARNSYWIIILSILLVICMFILTINAVSSDKKKLVVHVVSMKAPLFIKEEQNRQEQLTLTPPTDLHSAASVVTGLTLQVQKEKTLLRMLLSQDTFYRISMNAKKQYVIVFNHTQLVTNLPSINTLNSAIDDIRMINQINGDLYLILSLKKGAELTHLEFNTDGKYPEFQIDMNYKDTIPPNNNTAQENDFPSIEPIGRLTKSVITMGPEEEYQQAIQDASNGNTKKAITQLTGLVDKFPDYALARELLVKLLLDQGKTDQAKNIVQTGLQLHPFYPPYTELKARILVNEGQISDAINLLQHAAPSINKNPEYHAFIAALYQRQGQSLLAAKLYEQLLPLEPDNAVWWMGLGIAYDDLGKHNEAVQAYLRADNSDKLNPELKAFVESRMHSIQ